jgi:tetratricopeptide (TPR) repeat protein
MKKLTIALAACALLAATAATADKKSAARKGNPKEKAAALYRDGVAAYDAGKLAEALAAFTESYNLSGETGLLFNLGACSERLGDREKAAAFYSLYLEEIPDAPDAAEVRARLDAVRSPPEEKPAAAAPAQPVAPPPAPVIDDAPPAPEAGGDAAADEGESDDGTRADGASGRREDLGPALLMGLGGLALATGALTAIMAYKNYGDLESSCAPDCASGKVDRVRATAIAADVQLAAGGVAAAAGLVWLLAARHRESPIAGGGTSVAALPAAGERGVGLVVEGSF